MSSKPKLEAKIVKHAHRKRFYDYVRGKGKDKFTFSHVYWHMFLRSGKGNVFKLADELAAADLGMDVSILRTAHRTLKKDGWVVKNRPGNQGVPEWTVNTEAVSSDGKSTSGKPTAGKSTSAKPSTGLPTTAVVLHSQDAHAPTSSSTPSASTPPEELASEQASRLPASQDRKEEKPTPQGLEPESEDNTNPTIKPVYSDGRMNWVSEAEAVKELGLCFPAFKLGDAQPTPKEIRLMQEIIAKCDGYRVLPRTAMDYARKHKQGGLVPRSVKKLHEAICGEDTSSTNGLVAQTKEHSVETCGPCRKELAAMPCSRCHGATYGKPTIERGEPFCAECMKLPAYRRESGERGFLTSSI
jgi:hypothetical protein